MGNVRASLAAVQAALKAPKSQYNSFGKYKYRSCEDILEAVKPLLKEHGLTLTLCDSLTECGGRIYIRAAAVVQDVESGDEVEACAFAREPETKKGMDDSQITGTASSYARKYALNGLFCIDDTADADTEESRGREQAGPICIGCGEEIKAVMHKGTLYDAAGIARKAADTYGKPLCWNCMRTAKKKKEGA
jgi:hypothetical protein